MKKIFNPKSFRSAYFSLIFIFQAITPIASTAATGWNDPRFLQEKAELLIARATGAQAQQDAINARDEAALSSAECEAINTSARDAAVSYVERGQPISPEAVIQNSTCFLDILDIQIPVSMTGIGFLDGIITKTLSKLMTSACNQSMAFINQLKNNAVNQITNKVTGALHMDSLTIGGVNVSGTINGAVAGQVRGATNAAGNAVVSTGTNLLNNTTNPTNFFQAAGSTAGFP